jgi:hypothetical protein
MEFKTGDGRRCGYMISREEKEGKVEWRIGIDNCDRDTWTLVERRDAILMEEGYRCGLLAASKIIEGEVEDMYD